MSTVARPALPGTMPRTVDETLRMADMLAKSRLVPDDLKGKPQDVFYVIQAGVELGVPPTAAIRGIQILKGKPVFSADLMVGIAKGRGLCESFRCLASDAKAATYETKRRGCEPVQFTYTIEKARAMGLLSRPNWKAQPENMLRKRAKAALARDVYEDLLAGCYDPDEAQDFIDAEPLPANVIEAQFSAPAVDEDDGETQGLEVFIPERTEHTVIRMARCTTLDAYEALKMERGLLEGVERDVALKVHRAHLPHIKAGDTECLCESMARTLLPGVTNREEEGDDDF